MSANGRKKSSGGWLLFWLAFFTGISLLFILNMGRIKNTLRETGALDHLIKSNEDGAEEDAELVLHIQELAFPAETGLSEQAAGTALTEETAEQIAAILPDNSAAQNGDAAQSDMFDSNAVSTAQGSTIEQTVYLLRLDNTGTFLWTQVKRSLPASDSPLQDALEALIRGPSTEEERQGFISLIPKNVKILAALVRGNTAYINFNEDFLYNTYGVEGYSGQRRQIVLTATEFKNVNDVQILIDGKRVDYLGEGVWIGSPVSRNML